MSRATPLATRRDAVVAFVDDPGNLSPGQRAAVKDPGRFMLEACPGSGKTRTVGVRLAYWGTVIDEDLGRMRRIAATSYTNTAVREITQAAERAGQPVRDPQFVGTLHRFMLRYVVRPFARSYMGCDEAPRLIADPAGRRSPAELVDVRIGRITAHVPVWDFVWRADGTLTLIEVPYALRGRTTPAALAGRYQQEALAAKVALARRGLMSMSDALHWAMTALEDDNIANIVAGRFDELIIDEIQDTGDVLQRCILRLYERGVRSLVFAGDLEQAIYGFAHAQPAQLTALIRQTVKRTLPLDENWRSSQSICDVTHRFARKDRPDQAVGPHANVQHPPQLLVYPDGREQQAVTSFVERVEILGVPLAEAVVLCRRTATVDRLRGAPEARLGAGLGALVAGAAASQGGRPLTRETIVNIERLVLALADADADLDTLEAETRLKLRLGIMSLLDDLPGFDVSASAWAKAARDGVTALLEQIANNPTSPRYRIKAPTTAGNLTLAEVVGGPSVEPPIQTIHSVKGESHAAVLVVATTADDMPPDAVSWLGTRDPEERRVAYVAFTRAQRYLAVGLPRSSPQELIDEYLARGFVRHEEPAT